MSTPDDIRFEAALTGLAAAAAPTVEPVDVAVLQGRVRRRRTTRAALAAGAAALLVAAPAAWWLQDADGDENDTPPVGETSEYAPTDETGAPTEVPTTAGEPETEPTGSSGQAALPTFEDLVGAEIELPSFDPEGPGLEEYCPTEPAVLGDGVPDWEAGETFSRDDAAVSLFKVVHTPMSPDGPLEAVALVGCRPGDAVVRQAVTVAADGEGGWEVTDQVMLGGVGTDSLFDIAAAPDYGALLLIHPDESCCGTDPGTVEPRILWARDGSDPREYTGALPDAAIADLTVELIVVESEEEGFWNVEATVRNNGDQTSAPIQVIFCGSDHVQINEIEHGNCRSDHDALEVIDGLEPGSGETYEWTMEVPPASEWTDDERFSGLYLLFWAQPLMYGTDGLVFDKTDADNRAAHQITQEEAQ